VAAGELRGAWQSAAVVVIGWELALTLASAGLPRRSAVFVVSDREPGPQAWRAAVGIGAGQVLGLPGDEAELVEAISDAFEGPAGGGLTIAVIGGCGGAGASTVAAGLAVTSARETSTALVDADRLGGGLDVLFGTEQCPGARWPQLAATRGRLDTAALLDALPHVGTLALLSWDRAGRSDLPVEAAAAVLGAAVRGHRVVVVDLPRRLDEVSTRFVADATFLVLVVPATVRAVAGASAVAGQVGLGCRRIGLVVRDTGSGRLSPSEIAAALQMPVAATLRSEAAVASAAERGQAPLRRPRGSLHDACRALLAAATESAGGP
jgi:secretion/DNA translocation related CpaE-like protein